MTWIFANEQYMVRVIRPDGTATQLSYNNIPWQGTRGEAIVLIAECVKMHGPSGYQYVVERVPGTVK
jgi:hypothetical protein